MKDQIIILLFISIYASTANGQDNLDFENWILNQEGIEVPENWNTNNHPNYISVSKSTASVSGDFAASVISNGISFEGEAPGLLETVWSDLTTPVTNIAFSMNIDSIVDGAVSLVIANGYINNELLYADTATFSTATNGWVFEEIIPSDTTTVCDSLKLIFIAQSTLTPTGYIGFIRFLLDDIHFNQPLSVFRSEDLNRQTKIFPNPCHEKFEIILPSHVNAKSIQILSVSGNVMGRFPSDKLEIDVSSYAQGSYILQIETSEGLVIKKVLIR